jgi:hypothetical protein
MNHTEDATGLSVFGLAPLVSCILCDISYFGATWSQYDMKRRNRHCELRTHTHTAFRKPQAEIMYLHF